MTARGATPSAGEALLLRYHERHAGATAYTFGDARDERGHSSYQRLVDDVSRVRARDVLDLACGDGYLLERLQSEGRRLTGVDMSAAELAAAQRRLGDAATLVLGHATALPFATGAFDAVTSHLALMLMERLDAVLAETARVLAPDGHLFAIVGGGGGDEPVPAVLQAFRTVWLAAVERTGVTLPPIGDARGQDADAFEALLRAAGFVDVATERVVVRRPAAAHVVAEHYALFYPPAALDDAERARFRDDLERALRELERGGEELAFVSRLSHVRARRAAA